MAKRGKSEKRSLIIALIVSGIVFLAAAFLLINGLLQNSGIVDGKNYCSVDSRGQICYQLYNPVCGYFTQDVKCIKAPCAQNYSNSCIACADSKVDYWIKGECPA